MMYSPKLYLRDPWIGVPLIAVAGLQVFMWFYAHSRLPAAPELAFLHYNIIYGVDLVGAKGQIYYIPLAGTVIFILNYAVSFLRYRSDRLAAYIMSLAAVLVQVILVVALVVILRLNV